jgi:hypothetical protein
MPNNDPADPCAVEEVSHSSSRGDVFSTAKSINSELDQNPAFVQLRGRERGKRDAKTEYP